MSRDECPGCNSVAGLRICLFHDLSPRLFPSAGIVTRKAMYGGNDGGPEAIVPLDDQATLNMNELFRV